MSTNCIPRLLCSQILDGFQPQQHGHAGCVLLSCQIRSWWCPVVSVWRLPLRVLGLYSSIGRADCSSTGQAKQRFCGMETSTTVQCNVTYTKLDLMSIYNIFASLLKYSHANATKRESHYVQPMICFRIFVDVVARDITLKVIKQGRPLLSRT